VDLLRRALAALPERARAGGRVAVRADAGYFAGQLARAAHDEHIFFAIGARRIAPLWRLLDGVAEEDWTDAIEMDGRAGRGSRLPAGLVAGEHFPADPPGPAGTGAGFCRPAVAAVPHPAPGPARPPDRRTARC